VKIRQIEYFLEVEKTLNVTKAAQNMYVSQTAITKQLRLLEDELGFTLFFRENKRMELTEGGIFFKEEALRLMHQYDLTKQNVSAYRYGEAGCIHIGFLKNLDAKLLLSHLSLFRSLHPEIEVELYGLANKNLHRQIQNGSVDIGFGFTMNNSHFHYFPLKSYPLVALISRESPLAERSHISPQELKDVIIDARNHPENFSTDFEGLLAKIACGYGTAIVPQFAEANRFREYVASVPLKPIYEETIYLIYDDHYSKAKELFLETIQY